MEATYFLCEYPYWISQILFDNGVRRRLCLGYALCFDKILNLSGETELCFCPLFPEMKAEPYVVWKRHKKLSRCAEAFLKELKEINRTEGAVK